jgi:uncharacterized protein (DUF1800 family)
MRRYVQLLRAHALGRLEPLVQGLAHDLAILWWLGANANSRFSVNENFARGLLELYCLGPGQCSPRDIHEAARAQTGWLIERGQLRYFERLHDPDAKTLFGQRGNWTVEDLVRIAVAQPATSRWIVRKLYRWLVSETETPSDALLAPLTESYAKDCDMSRLVGTVLRSNLFYSAAAYRQRIKSPVEFAVGVIHSLEQLVPTPPLVPDLAAMGQNLCDPPTPKGWAGGRAWITSATLIARDNLAAALLAPEGRYNGKLDPEVAVRRHGLREHAAAKWWWDLLLQGDVRPEVRAGLLSGSRESSSSSRALVHGIITLPEFQLA